VERQGNVVMGFASCSLLRQQLQQWASLLLAATAQIWAR